MQLRQRVGERLGLDVGPQEPRGDALLELRRQLRNHPLGFESRITGRLGAERIEARSEMAVRPMRLDERHRGGDTAQELLVRRGRHRSSRRRLDDGRAAVPTSTLDVLQQPQQARLRGEEPRVAALEERAPLGRNRVGILEVLLEQLPSEAGVQQIDVASGHHTCCTSPEAGSLALVQGILREHGDREAADEARSCNDDRDQGQAATRRSHARGDQRQEDREGDDADGPVGERERASHDRERREKPSRELSRTSGADRCGLGTRARKRPCSGGRSGSSWASLAAPSSGRGSALTAHQTTAHRYTIGIFISSIRKMSSHHPLDMPRV